MFNETFFRMRFSASDLRDGYGHAPIYNTRQLNVQKFGEKPLFAFTKPKTDISTKQ